ncbi:HNH endonuclease [Pseudooceanicola antarcticus]|uniref:HNH endonuclease n=1 Tax=Pseudooceanicola antarcticus TaxID=1247613 RepID=UPI00117A98F3|nr:HNH endonuclease [Pseudooceanicola antarcticus]
MADLTEEEVRDFVETVLSQSERDAIDFALTAGNPWSHESFEDPIKGNLLTAKAKIKDFHSARVSKKCCYCRRSLEDASIESDREHIVPKGKKKSLSYNIFNLSIACKRCNMTYKGEKINHIVNFETIEADLRNSGRYLIPHPNIEVYDDHLLRISLQFGSKQITSYRCITDKGRFLYDFVRLDRLCVNEIDEAQGGEKVSEIAAELFDLPIGGV